MWHITITILLLLPLLLMPVWRNNCSFEKDLCWNNEHKVGIIRSI